jgi:hypothetical protein
MTQSPPDLSADLTLTPIAELVRSMFANGADPEAIACAVAALEMKARTSRIAPRSLVGTRLATDWTLPANFVEHAIERGMPRARIAIEAERFRNYWIAKAGQGAIKRDWFATWRNWVLTAMEGANAASLTRNDRTPPAARRAPTGADAVLAGMGRLAHRLAREREPARRDGTAASSRDDSDQLDLEGKRT